MRHGGLRDRLGLHEGGEIHAVQLIQRDPAQFHQAFLAHPEPQEGQRGRRDGASASASDAAMDWSRLRSAGASAKSGRNDPAATRSIVPGRCRRAGRRRRAATTPFAWLRLTCSQDDRAGWGGHAGRRRCHQRCRRTIVPGGAPMIEAAMARTSRCAAMKSRRSRRARRRSPARVPPASTGCPGPRARPGRPAWRNQDAAPGVWRLAHAVGHEQRDPVSCAGGRVMPPPAGPCPCGGCGTTDAWPPGESALPARRIRRRAPAARR